jgi:PEGA domain
MRSADVLVIGPLEPLLPRPVRVRLGLAVAGAVGLVCAGLLAALFWALYLRLLPVSLPESLTAMLPDWAPRRDSTTAAPVQVTSSPAGAKVFLGSRELGATPAIVTVSRTDMLVLRRDGFLDAFLRASGPNIDVALWRAQPESRLVRPPVPGDAIRSADFLPDGRVALAVEVPPTGERQPCAYDPVGARLDRLGSAATPGTLPSAVAIAPDGTHTAAILHLDGLDGAAADQLTLDGPDGARQPLSAVAVGERLLDVSWSPSAAGVLVSSQRRVTGGSQFHLRWVSTDGSVQDIADLPGEPVGGSWVWAPDGHAVAFLVRTSATALVTLDLASRELRYLACAAARVGTTVALACAGPTQGNGSRTAAACLRGARVGRCQGRANVAPVCAGRRHGRNLAPCAAPSTRAPGALENNR